jgi:hypothetical protein
MEVYLQMVDQRERPDLLLLTLAEQSLFNPAIMEAV